MKKINFLLLVAFTVFFFSCKKDSGNKNNSTYYIKATIGGTQKNYTSTPLVTVINASGGYALGLSANSSTTAEEGLGFEITSSTKPISTGSYNEYGTVDYSLVGTFNPGTTDMSKIFTAGLLNPFSSNPLQITISQYDDKVVSGTFSGEFFSDNGTGSDSVLISNGSFNLPR